jgi:hypothetical protein
VAGELVSTLALLRSKHYPITETSSNTGEAGKEAVLCSGHAHITNVVRSCRKAQVTYVHFQHVDPFSAVATL